MGAYCKPGKLELKTCLMPEEQISHDWARSVDHHRACADVVQEAGKLGLSLIFNDRDCKTKYFCLVLQ